jgi:hypothetical protein
MLDGLHLPAKMTEKHPSERDRATGGAKQAPEKILESLVTRDMGAEDGDASFVWKGEQKSLSGDSSSVVLFETGDPKIGGTRPRPGTGHQPADSGTDSPSDTGETISKD